MNWREQDMAVITNNQLFSQREKNINLHKEEMNLLFSVNTQNWKWTPPNLSHHSINLQPRRRSKNRVLLLELRKITIKAHTKTNVIKSSSWNKKRISIWMSPQKVILQKLELVIFWRNENSRFRQAFQRTLTDSKLGQMICTICQNEVYWV